MEPINLNITLTKKEQDKIYLTLTPLSIEDLVNYMQSTPLRRNVMTITNLGVLNNSYYKLEDVHKELRHHYSLHCED